MTRNTNTEKIAKLLKELPSPPKTGGRRLRQKKMSTAELDKQLKALSSLFITENNKLAAELKRVKDQIEKVNKMQKDLQKLEKDFNKAVADLLKVKIQI